MTSSATPTEPPEAADDASATADDATASTEAAAAAAPTPEASGAAPAAARPDPITRLRAWSAANPDWVAIAALALAGWALIGQVNDWYVGVPLVALAAGWLAILIGGRFLWRAAESAAREGEGGADEGFVVSSPRHDLETEKRALLKAIKEVEFDREMGKMSEADAGDLIRVYRARAIEILKALEDADGRPLTPEEHVERELRARLELARVGSQLATKKKRPADGAPAEPAGEENNA